MKRNGQLALFDAQAVTMSTVGLEFHRDLSFDECVRGAEQLGHIDRASRWVWGDLLNHVDTHYGERYGEIAAHSELDYQSLAHCKVVADAIEFCRRRQNLSWAHHAEVAPLDVEQQEYWLAQSENRSWSRRELRARLKAHKKKGLPTHTPLLRFCQDLPTPVLIAQILRVYFPDAETVFDMTGGDGGFWDGSELVRVERLIVDPASADGGESDFRSLPHLEDGAYDVTIFDPPHLAETGTSGIMGNKFGQFANYDELELAVREGCGEAWRIGLLGSVVKVTDHVHGSRYVLESDWVRDAIGEPPFDEVYQVRSHAVIDPKWEDQLSAYNNGSTYLIFRKGDQRHIGR